MTRAHRQQRVVRILTVIPLLCAAPVAADFCAELEVLVSASGNGFTELRGEQLTTHVDPVSEMRVVWRCRQGLPGADRCEVEWARQSYAYHLYWLGPDLEAHRRLFEAVAELLGQCGAGERRGSRSGRSLWFALPGSADLDIVLAFNEHRTRLSLTVIGFQRPDLE